MSPSRCAVLVLVALVMGCEPDTPNRFQGGSAAPTPGPSSDQGVASGSAGADARGGSTARDLPAADVSATDVSAAKYRVFDESAEDGRKVTLHLLVAGDPEGGAIRSALLAALRERADLDPELTAIRAVAYRAGPMRGRAADLLAVAWAELVPPEGWQAAETPMSRGPHRATVYREGAG